MSVSKVESINEFLLVRRAMHKMPLSALEPWVVEEMGSLLHWMQYYDRAKYDKHVKGMLDDCA